MTDPQHIELLAQQLAGRRQALVLSPAAVAAPILSLLVIAVFAVVAAACP